MRLKPHKIPLYTYSNGQNLELLKNEHLFGKESVQQSVYTVSGQGEFSFYRHV